MKRFYILLFTVISISSISQNYISPFDFPLILSGTFGELRSNHFHSGIDIKTESVEGKEIRSIADGYISRIKVSTWGYGKVIYIVHPKTGHTSVYAHMQVFNDEIKKIIASVLKKSDSVLVSRIQKKDYSKVINFSKKNNFKIKKGKNTTTVLIFRKIIKKSGAKIGIITAGTSDIGVAEEAKLMCESMNCECITSYDIGIAGLHRTFPILKEFVKADVDVIIVAAGMEGALASVVSSLSLIHI